MSGAQEMPMSVRFNFVCIHLSLALFIRTLKYILFVRQREPKIHCLVYVIKGPGRILHNLMMLRVRGEAGLVLETGDNHAADKVKRPR